MRVREPSTTNDPLREFESIEQLSAADRLSEGRFSVIHESYPVDFLFRDSESDTLIVSFHGAAPKTVRLPWHAGKNVMEGVPAKWLAISDPSLLFSDTLNLAWFAGSNRQPDLQGFIASVIKSVSQNVGVQHQIFFGSSGGGFAALEMSRRFTGSLVIPMNPQTSIGNYHESAVNRYLDKAWSAKTLNDSKLSSSCFDVVQAYDENHSNTVAYVQNVRDSFHIRGHQRPFFEKLSTSPNLWVKTGSWGDQKKTGHVIPPKDEVNELLRQTAASAGSWYEVLAKLGFRQAAIPAVGTK